MKPPACTESAVLFKSGSLRHNWRFVISDLISDLAAKVWYWLSMRKNTKSITALPEAVKHIEGLTEANFNLLTHSRQDVHRLTLTKKSP